MDYDSIAEELESNCFTQWSLAGGIYTPSYPTVPRLPPGYYQYGMVMGQVRLLRKNLDLDGVLRLQSRNMNEILHDIEAFWDREKKFIKYGLPYKRGLLLSGPPGTGKTCLIKLLVKDLIRRKGICLEYNGEPDELETVLGTLSEIQEDTPVVVIMEDIDRQLVTSRLLNILDGMTPLYKVVFLATTNHPGELDEALSNRPGRLDAHYKIDPPSRAVRKQFIGSLLTKGDLRKVPMKRYLADTDGLTIGHIKELVVSVVILGKDYEQTLEMLRNLQTGRADSEEEKDPEGLDDDDSELAEALYAAEKKLKRARGGRLTKRATKRKAVKKR